MNARNSQISTPEILGKLSAPAVSILVYEGDQNVNSNGTPGTSHGWFDPANMYGYESSPYTEPSDNSVGSWGNHANYQTPVATGRHQPHSVFAPYNNASHWPNFVDGSNNYIFCDGHVKYLDWERVSNTGNSHTLASPDLLGAFSTTFAAVDGQA